VIVGVAEGVIVNSLVGDSLGDGVSAFEVGLATVVALWFSAGLAVRVAERVGGESVAMGGDGSIWVFSLPMEVAGIVGLVGGPERVV
jgi:hypothetical protein